LVVATRPRPRVSAGCDVHRRLGSRVHDDVLALLLRHLAAALRLHVLRSTAWRAAVSGQRRAHLLRLRKPHYYLDIAVLQYKILHIHARSLIFFIYRATSIIWQWTFQSTTFSVNGIFLRTRPNHNHIYLILGLTQFSIIRNFCGAHEASKYESFAVSYCASKVFRSCFYCHPGDDIIILSSNYYGCRRNDDIIINYNHSNIIIGFRPIRVASGL